MAESGAARAVAPLEVDSDSGDWQSIDDDLTSVSSSIYNYEYENGRTYHSFHSGSYILPNDEKEQDRLDLLHHVFRLCLHGDLARTKLDNPQKILDVGTGTGIWAIQVADEYPSAEVIGVDLSPIQPSWTPPNLQFIVDDVNEEWAFPADSFDFIHVRGLAGSLTDWPTFLKRCYKHLKPGGTIELSECRTHMECDDGSYPKESQTYKWIEAFNQISHDLGRVFDLFPEYKNLLADAHFENVQSTEEVCPIGTWPKDKRLKEIGWFFRAQFLESAIDSYSLALFMRFGGWSREEAEVLFAHVRQEIKTNEMHVYTHCSFATAQKPLR